MGENRLMSDLYEENQRLKARISELEEKHWNECGQIAHYDDELKDLREENKVLMQECDRLIKEKGELLKKSEQIAEYKRLLKAAVEDFHWIESHTEDGKGHCCISGDNNELACIHCPLNQRNKDTIMCGWNYEDEALALIGEDTNVPASKDGDTNE